MKTYNFDNGTVKAINRILKQIDITAGGTDIDLIHEIILKYKHKLRKHYHKMDFKVEDGFLYIDNMPTERIASKLSINTSYSDYSYHMEGKILERQGL